MAPQAAKALKTNNYSSTIAQQVTIKTMHSEYKMTPQKSRFYSDMPPASEEGGELCADGDGWCGQPGKGFLLKMIIFLRAHLYTFIGLCSYTFTLLLVQDK